jgi:hypothetical protein
MLTVTTIAILLRVASYLKPKPTSYTQAQKAKMPQIKAKAH